MTCTAGWCCGKTCLRDDGKRRNPQVPVCDGCLADLVRERDEARKEVARLRGIEYPEAIMEMCNDVVTLDARELAAMHDREIASSAEQRGFERGVEAAMAHVANHYTSASCCDAQPSTGEAKELAECVRRKLLPAPSDKTKEGGM